MGLVNGNNARAAQVGRKRQVRQRRVWQDIAERFPDDADCLASFLALECAEVLHQAKPANLVNIANRARPCGRNLYALWKEHGERLVAQSGISVKVLADRESSLLLLFYRLEGLSDVLRQRSAQVILQRAGYREPWDLGKALSELESRCQQEGSFPHEIGVFLGYPLKDVVGFMGWARVSFTCQGPWKIFGDPTESLKLAERHRRCRCKVSRLLDSGCNPHECLKGASRRMKKVTH